MKRVSLALIGFGGVGRALLRQILDARGYHERRYGLRFDVEAVADSCGVLVEVGAAALREALEAKESGHSLGEVGRESDDPLSILNLFAFPEAIAVDCTASGKIGPRLAQLVEAGGSAVLANKKPLTGPLERYRRIARPGLRTRWESTVASGVPVIATLNRLKSCRDEINRIEGALSGTLGRIMTGLEDGRPFSHLVREAYESGATEPDPRDDLKGTDVARKALILARGMDLEVNLEDIPAQSLYPSELDSLPVAEFLDALASQDAPLSQRFERARREGKVLRYAFRVTPREQSAGLREVPRDSPLGSLRGSDNLVEFHTRWYPSEPLVLRGRGLGVEATAAGVLSDIIELSF